MKYLKIIKEINNRQINKNTEILLIKNHSRLQKILMWMLIKKNFNNNNNQKLKFNSCSNNNKIRQFNMLKQSLLLSFV